MTTKPVPRFDATDAPFWAACNQERVMLQRCVAPSCRRFVYYPRVCCPHCRSGDLEWVEVLGRGRVETYTIVHRPHHEGFAADTPYIFAAVTLDEDVLVYGRIEDDGSRDRELIGKAVAPVFVQHTPDQKLLAFRLSGSSGSPMGTRNGASASR